MPARVSRRVSESTPQRTAFWRAFGSPRSNPPAWAARSAAQRGNRATPVASSEAASLLEGIGGGPPRSIELGVEAVVACPATRFKAVTTRFVLTVSAVRKVLLSAALALVAGGVAVDAASPEARPRAHEIGIVIGRLQPGPLDAITDVTGVRVGQVTRSFGEGKLVPGRGPARTGVTAIIPRDDVWHRKCPAAAAVANGCGEVTGIAWVNESGWLEVPIVVTNSHAVGRAFDAVITWMQRGNPKIGVDEDVVDPVVGECDDSAFNDIRGRHVREEDVLAALDGARGGAVEEGAVGAGTGMESFAFKSGVGTASRVVQHPTGAYTVGALVVANFGDREELILAGVPIGREMPLEQRPFKASEGSIVIVVATDAPLDSRQLGRVARRAPMALARLGTPGHHGSGDFCIAFSTAHVIPEAAEGKRLTFRLLSDLDLDPFFQAAEEAIEESVVNSLLRARTIVGRDGNRSEAIPIAHLKRVLAKYGR
ncbi:MAG: P1 family peptidase [Candidatus Wallbacteria bacterium]|nr:P1 family peptidase [Candidatus Wallbacteria bacterium]